jgi:hypothetical protein
LERVLSAWDRFQAGELSLDSVRDSVRAAARSLDGSEAQWRDLLDEWSLNLDGVDARITRHRSEEVVRSALLGRFTGEVASVRRYLGVVVDDDECQTCGHPWDLHPGVNPWLNVCGMCIAEEDHDERAYEDMCTLQPESASRPLPEGRLRPRVAKRFGRGYRIYIEDWQGQRWATLAPQANTQDSADQLAAEVEHDLATMTLKTLREKYLG